MKMFEYYFYLLLFTIILLYYYITIKKSEDDIMRSDQNIYITLLTKLDENKKYSFNDTYNDITHRMSIFFNRFKRK